MMPSFTIKFSRHAKRRMSLYNISEDMVLGIVNRNIMSSDIRIGKHEIVEQIEGKPVYPIKVVFSLEKNEIIVITAYPLKKGLSK
jgi:hypothetical protein